MVKTSMEIEDFVQTFRDALDSAIHSVGTEFMQGERAGKNTNPFPVAIRMAELKGGVMVLELLLMWLEMTRDGKSDGPCVMDFVREVRL